MSGPVYSGPVEVKRIYSFPFSNFFTQDNINAVLSFVPRNGDVILSSYPCATSSWLTYSIWKLVNVTNPKSNIEDFYRCSLNCIESTGTTQLNRIRGPRLITCHLPYRLMHRNPNARYIYVTRHPRDTLVAYFLTSVKDCGVRITFSQFLEAFNVGHLPCGNYFDHVRSWYKEADSNVLFLNYEMMHLNPQQRILEVAEYLGPSYYKACLDDSVMEYILKCSDQDYKTFTIRTDGLVKDNMKELVTLHSKDASKRIPPIQAGKMSFQYITSNIGISKRILFRPVEEEQMRYVKKMNEFVEEMFKDKSDLKEIFLL